MDPVSADGGSLVNNALPFICQVCFRPIPADDTVILVVTGIRHPHREPWCLDCYS